MAMTAPGGEEAVVELAVGALLQVDQGHWEGEQVLASGK